MIGLFEHPARGRVGMRGLHRLIFGKIRIRAGDLMYPGFLARSDQRGTGHLEIGTFPAQHGFECRQIRVGGLFPTGCILGLLRGAFEIPRGLQPDTLVDQRLNLGLAMLQLCFYIASLGGDLGDHRGCLGPVGLDRLVELTFRAGLVDHGACGGKLGLGAVVVIGFGLDQIVRFAGQTGDVIQMRLQAIGIVQRRQPSHPRSQRGFQFLIGVMLMDQHHGEFQIGDGAVQMRARVVIFLGLLGFFSLGGRHLGLGDQHGEIIAGICRDHLVPDIGEDLEGRIPFLFQVIQRGGIGQPGEFNRGLSRSLGAVDAFFRIREAGVGRGEVELERMGHGFGQQRLGIGQHASGLRYVLQWRDLALNHLALFLVGLAGVRLCSGCHPIPGCGIQQGYGCRVLVKHRFRLGRGEIAFHFQDDHLNARGAIVVLEFLQLGLKGGQLGRVLLHHRNFGFQKRAQVPELAKGLE